MVKFRKVTVFEGFYDACWETSYLTKEPECKQKGRIQDYRRRWFREYLQDLVKRKKEPEEERILVSLDDILPTQVFEELLQDPKTKFRFNINVEVEQI